VAVSDIFFLTDMSPEDEVDIKQFLSQYLVGTAQYAETFDRYMRGTWQVLDNEFVKSVDGVWVEYLNKFITEDEFKERLKSHVLC
jgi:hypothetical protein